MCEDKTKITYEVYSVSEAQLSCMLNRHSSTRPSTEQNRFQLFVCAGAGGKHMHDVLTLLEKSLLLNSQRFIRFEGGALLTSQDDSFVTISSVS